MLEIPIALWNSFADLDLFILLLSVLLKTYFRADQCNDDLNCFFNHLIITIIVISIMKPV